jgi:hypothetical protein
MKKEITKFCTSSFHKEHFDEKKLLVKKKEANNWQLEKTKEELNQQRK